MKRDERSPEMKELLDKKIGGKAMVLFALFVSTMLTCGYLIYVELGKHVAK